MTSMLVGQTAVVLLAVGCTNDPAYLPSPTSIDAGEMTDMDGNLVPGVGRLVIPVVRETMEDATDRMRRQAMITDAAVVLPYIAVDDLQISVEWTIRNLTAMPGNATVQLNGANQFFRYDPTMLQLSADDEAPPPPGLDGDVPLDVPANGTISGLFTEDSVREAAVDLDQITRGNINPFRATLTISKNVDQFAQLAPLMFDMDGEPLPQMPTGSVFPRQAIPAMLEIDLVFKPDRHMVLEYTVRVRDVRGDLLPDKLLAADMAELEPFMPADFAIMATATP
ncbi:MAG: hypothetical protein JNL83_09410 [Myxococcales bacterium]|nr:hypothetical protein [Myxococcales bacterium]